MKNHSPLVFGAQPLHEDSGLACRPYPSQYPNYSTVITGCLCFHNHFHIQVYCCLFVCINISKQNNKYQQQRKQHQQQQQQQRQQHQQQSITVHILDRVQLFQ